MLFSRTTVLICAVAICAIASAQTRQATDVKFGDITTKDFTPAYYSADSSADGVYLYDAGSTYFENNAAGWFSIVYKVHKRIRLLNKNSFNDLATIKISRYAGKDYQQKIEDLQAATYNIEGDSIHVIKLDKSSIFIDKEGEYEISKFTFPDLKEGSIIEYEYTVKGDVPYGYAFIPNWSFQGYYPRLWSEYTIEIPDFLDFVVLGGGYLTPAIDTVISSKANFNILIPRDVIASHAYDFRSNTIKHTWAYQDVPAIKEEKFITDLSNYIQKLEFQYSAYRHPLAQPRFYMHTWPEAIDQLMEDEDFGADLNKPNFWLKDDIKAAVRGETDPVNKARKIYEYVRDNYNCIDHSAIYLSQPLKKTQQSKKGNVVDINMLLVAMLRVAGYNADPVLLSTRGNGKTVDIYPILSKFNYLIAHVNIDSNTSYLLDAGEPLLGFGRLSKDCYNGNARTIASTPVLINLVADSLHESEITTLVLSNDPEGKVVGTYKHVFGEMQSVEMREKMKKINANEYFEDINKSFPFEVSMSNKTIDSLKQPEMPVSVQYDFSFKPEDDILYFTPVLADAAYKENPFKAAQRFYPVEMPYCIDETYILNMEVPAGYAVDELPKSSRVKLNENEGAFEYLIQQDGNHIQLRCRLKLSKANFEPEDYQMLRNFYSLIIEKENQQIVFKRR